MPALIGGSEKERLIGLDLARAAAILGVLCMHFAGPALARAGFTGWPIALMTGFGELGVELFFALSGFLIGSLLLDIVERDPGFRSWSVFLVRRWMRTLPLYFLWLALLLVFAPPQQDVALHALKYLTFTQNFAWPMPADNWFGVSWSLAVEEWFYVLFSALLLALAVRTKRWAVLISCAIFIAVPIVLRTYIGPIDFWNSGFRAVTVFRLDAIAYGVVFAWLYRYRLAAMQRLAYPLLALGACFIVFYMASRVTMPMGIVRLSLVFTLAPLGFSMMMPWFAQIRLRSSHASAVIHWLSTRSYCLYITHMGIRQLGHAWLDEPFGPNFADLAVLLACALLADLSYRYFEMPILKRRPRQLRQTPIAADASGVRLGESLRARQAT